MASEKVEVNGVYKYDRYEHILLNNLCIISYVKVFATICMQCCMLNFLSQRRPAIWPNMTHYIDPYDGHMDQILKISGA